MRVATYTQAGVPTRGSMFALSVLVLTILLGTGIVPTLTGFIGGPLDRLLTPLWLLMYVSALLGLMVTHGINWISWLVRYRILLVLLILGTILSITWSIDARVSAERTVHLVGSTLLAVYIGFTIPLLTTLRLFAVILALAMLATVAAAVGLPALGIENYEGTLVWRGVFNSKNDLGFWAAVGVLLYITLSDSLHSIYWKLLCFMSAGLCLAVLALSQSATSLLALIIAGALSIYLFIASHFRLGFFRMAILAALLTGVIAMAIANIDTAELVGRSGDMTGRGEVWAQVWKLILNHPLTGVGYGSLWFPTDNTIWIQQSLTDFTWIVYHAHNGLLQVASEVGLPLAVIALLMVAQQLIEIFYCQYERQQVGVLFVLAFVTAYLVSNYSEARFLVTRELFWIFFIALPISMLRQINLVHIEQPPEGLQGRVPGKPWLGPMTQEPGWRSQTASGVASGVSGGAVLMTYAPGSASFHDRLDPLESETLDASAQFTLPENDENPTALGSTDIDLGGLVADVDHEPQGETEESETDMSDIDVLALMQEDISDLRMLVDPDSLQEDDTLNVDGYDADRYDKHFDMSGEWVDIDLTDDR